MKIHRTTWIIAASIFFVFAGYSPTQQFLLDSFEKQGRGDLAQAVLIVLYGALAATGLLLPKVSHRLPSIRATFVAAAITYVLFITTAAIANATAMITAAMLLGIGGALLWATVGRTVVEYTATELQGRSFAVINTAFGLGASIGVTAFQVGGTLSMLAVSAGIGMAVLALLPGARLRGMKEDHREKESGGKSVLWPLLGMNAMAMIFTGLLFGGIMLFGLRQFGARYGFIVSILPLANIAGGIIGGWLSDKSGRIHAIAAMLTCFLVSTGLIAFGREQFFAFATATILGSVMYGGLYAALQGCGKELLSGEARANFFYFFQTSSSLGIVAAMIVSLSRIETIVNVLIAAALASCIFLFWAKTAVDKR